MNVPTICIVCVKPRNTFN